MSAIKKLLSKESNSPTAVAAALSEPKRKCSRQLVEYWLAQGYVTPKWAYRVHNVYGIPLHDLNPSVFPKSAA